MSVDPPPPHRGSPPSGAPTSAAPAARFRPPAPAWQLARALLAPGEELPALGLLIAAPGFGKSYAMAQLLASAERNGAMAIWIRLAPLDGDPATFFPLLASALRRLVPGFGGTLAALAARPDADVRACWGAFWAELEAYNVPRLCLALDDAHHLASPDGADRWPVLDGLAAELEGLGHRVLATTRRRPATPLARATARGLVRVWDAASLRVSDAEAQAWWRARAGEEAPLGADVLDRLDGWPLGLDLWCALPAARRPGAAALAHEALQRLVAEELFHTQPADRQAFMLGAACLPAVEAATCAALLDDAHAPAALAEVAAENLVELVAEGCYRFPSYLGDFLRAEAARRWPAERRRAIAGRVAAAALADGRPGEAIGWYLEADDAAGAVDAARRAIPAWLALGRRPAVAAALAQLARRADLAPGWLALWEGLLASFDGDHAAARTATEAAHAAFQAAGDGPGELKAAVRLATIAAIHHDQPAFGRWLTRAMAIAPQGHPEDQADLHLARALRAEQRGDLPLMRSCNEAVLALPIGANLELATCASIAALNLATHALYLGALDEARRHLDRTLALAEAWELTPFAIVARFMRADVGLTRGELTEAANLVAGLTPGWEAALAWHERGCALAVVGRFLDLADRPREADDTLKRALGIFTGADLAEGRKMVLERLAAMAIRRRHPERALAVVASAGPLGDDVIHDLALRVAGARARHLAGAPAEALAELDAVRPALAAAEAWLLLARAALYAAAACRAAGDEATASEHVGAFEALEAAHGYRFLRATDPDLWRELAPDRFAPATSAPAPAAIAPSDAAAEPPGPRLEATCFGPFEARLAGIRLDHWPRRKAKLVLAALLLYPRGLGQFELAELLADGAPVANLNALHVNVMALRRALEPDLAKGDDSRYVRWREERYLLAPEALAPSPIAAFEAAIARAAGLRARQPEAALAAYDEALAWYQGDLFDDAFLGRYFAAERETLRRKALEALLWQAEAHIGADDEARAMAAWRRAMTIDPADPAAYLALIELDADRGRLEPARRTYWAYRKALQARLGLAPDEAFETAVRAALGS